MGHSAMNTDRCWELEELIPHAHPMILIDSISEPDVLITEGIQEAGLNATVRIAEDSQFYERPSGVPAWVGIEYVAQTVAALAGLRAKRAGKPVALGFLLGTRRFEASIPYFPIGAKLSIHVSPEFESTDLAKYTGLITDEHSNVLVKTAITVFLVPTDRKADGNENG